MTDILAAASQIAEDPSSNAPKGFCCQTDSTLEDLKKAQQTPDSDFLTQPTLVIYDAAKTYDGTGSSFIVYCIRYANVELKRRYSEFYSLRNLLTTLHPTIIIPPIPEKQSLADYAAKPSRARHDPLVIDRRKRMLQSFLNRVARHPVLSADHYFHRFIQPGVHWGDVIGARHTDPASRTAASSLASTIVNAISPVSSSPGAFSAGSLSQSTADPEFAEMEQYTRKFEAHVRDVLEKTHRRVMKRHSELSVDYGDLGMVYNSLSLTDTSSLAPALDKIGQAYDAVHTNLIRFLGGMETQVSETLHEYTQFADIVQAVLRFRRQRQHEYEQTCELLNSRLQYFSHLEKVEVEARRLEEALHKEGYRAPNTTTVPNGKSKGIVGALSDKLTSVMDTDPDSSRRHNIEKTKEVITQLESQREKQLNSVTTITASVHQELGRFQREKLEDVRQLLIRYATLQAELCRKNLRVWKEARAELNESLQGSASGTNQEET